MTDEEKKFLLSLFSFDNKLSDNNKIKKLYSMSSNIEKCYKVIEINKKNGKIRKVYSPNYYLKYIERNILNNILYDKKVLDFVTAYQKGKSIKDNALVHINKKIILKLDIKSFFDNISFIDVYNVFKSFGFSKRITSLLSYLCTYNDYLPQGAPTSSYISNLVLRSFDIDIYNWCSDRNISYTRYSDDMTFSMDSYNKELVSFIRKKLYKFGLELNNDKICIINNYNKQKITGIIVNNKLNVDILYRKKIRQEVYYIKKFGINSHLDRLGIEDKKKYLLSLLGRINFVLNINRLEEFIKYRDYIKELL